MTCKSNELSPGAFVGIICENSCWTLLPHIIDFYSHNKYGCRDKSSNYLKWSTFIFANFEMFPQIQFVHVYRRSLIVFSWSFTTSLCPASKILKAVGFRRSSFLIRRNPLMALKGSHSSGFWMGSTGFTHVSFFDVFFGLLETSILFTQDWRGTTISLRKTCFLKLKGRSDFKLESSSSIPWSVCKILGAYQMKYVCQPQLPYSRHNLLLAISMYAAQYIHNRSLAG